MSHTCIEIAKLNPVKPTRDAAENSYLCQVCVFVEFSGCNRAFLSKFSIKCDDLENSIENLMTST